MRIVFFIHMTISRFYLPEARIEGFQNYCTKTSTATHSHTHRRLISRVKQRKKNKCCGSLRIYIKDIVMTKFERKQTTN